jgi:hypothetical protein
VTLVPDRILTSFLYNMGRKGISLAGFVEKISFRIQIAGGHRYISKESIFSVLEKSTGLEGAHAGCVVVVMGSGPSLSKIDPGVTEGKVTIALNEAFLTLSKRGMRADYHVVIDPFYYSGEGGGALNALAKFVHQTGAILITDYRAKYGAFKDLDPLLLKNVRYIFQMFPIERYYKLEIPPTIRLTQTLPEFTCATEAAIMLGLAFGGEDIRLVAHEFDYLGNSSQPVQHSYGASPFYDDTMTVKEAYSRGGDQLHDAVVRRLIGLAVVKGAADSHGVTITNDTPNSFLPIFHRD